MRILLIGDQSIQNDALKAIISSKDDWQVRQLTHQELQEKKSIDKQFRLLLIDLTSAPFKPTEYVKAISEKKFSDHLIALHAYLTSLLTEPLLEAGADYCFSLDDEPEDLLDVLSQLDGK